MWRRLFPAIETGRGMSGLVMVPAGTGPPLLISSPEKQNQNFTWDLVLVRQVGGVMVTEAFDLRPTG